MGKIVRDERYENYIWCLCNNYNEYLQFAKDLFLYTGLYNQYSEKINAKRWITSAYQWSDLFDVPTKIRIDENQWGWEEAVDPINDSYVIREKPDESEYPVIVQYDNYNKIILWISLNKLRTESN